MAAEAIVDVVHCLRLPLLHKLKGQLLIVDVGGAVAAPASADLASSLTAHLRGDFDVVFHQLCLLNYFLELFMLFSLVTPYPNVLLNLVILYMCVHKLHEAVMSSFYTVLVFSSRPFCLSHLSNLLANIIF